MKFVKLDNYYVNLDQIVCIQEENETLSVMFKNASDTISLSVKKEDPQGKHLLAVLHP
jgi:hypothetical protein